MAHRCPQFPTNGDEPSDNGSRQYVLIGKAGVAVVGSVESRQYQLLVYGDKQKTYTKASITPKFHIIVRLAHLANG